MARRLTIRQCARLLDIGAITSEELSRFCHSVAVAGEEIWGLSAYEVLANKENLLDQARASDDRRRLGESLSIFDGLPVSIKANLAVAEYPLTAGSKILGMGRTGMPPCGYDADVVRRLLRDSGSVLIGVTSMDEFGMGSFGNTAVLPDGTPRLTKNPLPLLRHLKLGQEVESRSDEENMARIVKLPHDAILEAHSNTKNNIMEDAVYSAGGSSCGSAASVAHGSALLSLGTDTGGSVRQPSAWCGLVGLKPTYGILSRHGAVAYASSFDTVGILAKTTDCAALAFDILAQRDDRSQDPTFTFISEGVSAVPDDIKELNRPLEGLHVGIPAAFSVTECPSAIRRAWSSAAKRLQSQGATVHEISTEDITPSLVQSALSAYFVLVSAEASSNLSRYDGFRYGVASGERVTHHNLTPLEQQYAASRTEGFGVEVARRILCGTSVLSSEHFQTQYGAAAKLRAVLAHQLHSVLNDKVDVILIPTCLSLPHRLDKETINSTEMLASDVMTVPSNLAGLPTVSIPFPMDGEDTFQAGMSLIGSRLDERTILKVGQVLERNNS